jgi:hypothetical protein
VAIYSPNIASTTTQKYALTNIVFFPKAVGKFDQEYFA